VIFEVCWCTKFRVKQTRPQERQCSRHLTNSSSADLPRISTRQTWDTPLVTKVQVKVKLPVIWEAFSASKKAQILVWKDEGCRTGGAGCLEYEIVLRSTLISSIWLIPAALIRKYLVHQCLYHQKHDASCISCTRR